MSILENKNEIELQRRDQEILEAIYEKQQTISEYAAAHSLTYEEAEKQLGDALRRKKTELTYVQARSVLPDGTHYVMRQGFRKILRSRAATQAPAGYLFPDFYDLDDWLEIDG